MCCQEKTFVSMREIIISYSYQADVQHRDDTEVRYYSMGVSLFSAGVDVKVAGQNREGFLYGLLKPLLVSTALWHRGHHLVSIDT